MNLARASHILFHDLTKFISAPVHEGFALRRGVVAAVRHHSGTCLALSAGSSEWESSPLSEAAANHRQA